MGVGALSLIEPPRNCRGCPRLAAYRRDLRKAHPEWHNAPVETWLPPDGPQAVRLLIVGLAPGLRGANRTGRTFTGDASGDLLVPLMHALAMASDANGADAELIGTAVTNAVRCVPPQNSPTGAETNTCRTRFLTPLLECLPNLRAVLTLGKTAHDATVRCLGGRINEHPFAHGARSRIAGPNGALTLTASYHCSRYNVNTGRLTPDMLANALRAAGADSLNAPD